MDHFSPGGFYFYRETLVLSRETIKIAGNFRFAAGKPEKTAGIADFSPGGS